MHKKRIFARNRLSFAGGAGARENPFHVDVRVLQAFCTRNTKSEGQSPFEPPDDQAAEEVTREEEDLDVGTTHHNPRTPVEDSISYLISSGHRPIPSRGINTSRDSMPALLGHFHIRSL